MHGRTVQIAQAAGLRVLHAPKGRAAQMNCGAAEAKGDDYSFIPNQLHSAPTTVQQCLKPVPTLCTRHTCSLARASCGYMTGCKTDRQCAFCLSQMTP